MSVAPTAHRAIARRRGRGVFAVASDGVDGFPLNGKVGLTGINNKRAPVGQAGVQQGVALSCFACPICANPMVRTSEESGSTGGATLRCGANYHSFDVAREGHVNLIAATRTTSGGKGHARKSRAASGDTADMLRARRRFLRSGHYREVSDHVNGVVLAYVAYAEVVAASEVTAEREVAADKTADGKAEGVEAGEVQSRKKLTPRQRRLGANKRRSQAAKAQARVYKDRDDKRRRVLSADLTAFPTPPPLVVDFGCGEGWWLERIMLAATTTSGSGTPTLARFAAIDASPEAARMTAKVLSVGSSSAEVAVADAQSEALPFLDGSVAAALSVFAPRNPRELHRVVAPLGAVVIVSPGTSHLSELRAAARETGGIDDGGGAMMVLDIAEGKQERNVQLMEAAGFVMSEETAVEGVMELRLGDVQDLIGMGPSAFHQSEDSQRAISKLFGDDGVVSVTKSFVVQVFRKAATAATDGVMVK